MFGLTMKQLLGDRAIHVPMHGIIQNQDNGVVACVFLSKVEPSNPLLIGATETHVFVHGDMIVRPRLAFASNHLRGTGLAGLLKSSAMASPEEWITNGRMLLEPR